MSNLEDHNAEQAAITAACEAGTCDHPECHKGKIRYVCSECGEESIYWEGNAYWDTETQSLELGGDADTDSTGYCGDCGAEDCAKVERIGE